jgi:anti-sigma B factor antagonist
MREGAFEIAEREADGVLVFALRMGPGQRGSIDGFHRLICARIDEGQSRFVVNLSECSWIDSKGLGELVKALVAVMRQGGGLKVAELPERLRTIFEITNLMKVFEVFESEADAIQSYGFKKY